MVRAGSQSLACHKSTGWTSANRGQPFVQVSLSRDNELIRPSESEQSSVYRQPAAHAHVRRQVSLVTQLSLSRLPRFAKSLAAWNGPVSIALYLTDPGDALAFRRFLLSTPSHLSRWHEVALTIVKPSYATDIDSLTERLRYPINRLRNLAIALAPTDYIVVVDADFVPSPDMHFYLRLRGIPLIEAARSTSPTMKRTAIVVSAFTLLPDHHGSYPRTPEELHSALTDSPPIAALMDRNAGHGPTRSHLLFTRSEHQHDRQRWAYEVCYEPQWEPYYLLHRPSHPLYDERFTDQGGDKQSHALLLNALGFRFLVLRDVWFMHPPRGVDEEEGVDEWPSARLAQAQEEDHEDKAHFSPAQRDANRFRYFQDYVPEILARFGWNARFPGGCSAAGVGGGSFGKGSSRSIFGL